MSDKVEILDSGGRVVDVVEAGYTMPGGGGGGPVSYTHVQTVPAAVWTINHQLGYRPAITVLDVDGDPVDGTPAYPSLNSMTITFAATVAGVAHLS
ncbi:hypothetical protein SAMN05421505_12079 [Sinosporangium album]|uniref:Uncharacterized protein n=1 Tax=Sinosporangium album TaxID=504805 RepID=A0A1G8EFN7_9ACTN|nr:hypothetical protein [Sinosporangium album]SDH68687.1 hypothetical protein SAMN05421505_12079 [Sinosporangium album]